MIFIDSPPLTRLPVVRGYWRDNAEQLSHSFFLNSLKITLDHRPFTHRLKFLQAISPGPACPTYPEGQAGNPGYRDGSRA